jgi:hypothetical protein
MKKWLFRGFVVVCMSAGLMLSAFGYANSKAYKPRAFVISDNGCGRYETCSSPVDTMTIFCFYGCWERRGCGSGPTGPRASARCCRTYVYFCLAENRTKTIKSCTNAGQC